MLLVELYKFKKKKKNDFHKLMVNLMPWTWILERNLLDYPLSQIQVLENIKHQSFKDEGLDCISDVLSSVYGARLVSISVLTHDFKDWYLEKKLISISEGSRLHNQASGEI